MGGYLTVPLGIFIILGVYLFEIIRKKEDRFDYLTGINIIYVITFGVVPVYLYFYSEQTTWRIIQINDFSDVKFLIALLYSMVGYLSLVVAYYLGGKLSLINKKVYSKKIFENITDKVLLNSSLILLMIGVPSMIIYIYTIGGWNNYMTLGSLLRTGSSAFNSPLMFFKNLVPLLYPASFIFYVLLIESKRNKILYLSLFVLTFVLSTLHLYHASGRMSIFIYFATFPLCHMIYRNKINKSLVAIGSVFGVFMIVFGDQLTNASSTKTLKQSWDDSLSNIGSTIGGVIQEFSFPYTNLKHFISIFPEHLSFRYGLQDIAVGLNEILPSRLLPTFQGETITALNTRIFGSGAGAIPVDFVSFGYASFGLAGIIIVGIAFGLLTRFTETIFSYRGSFASSMLYSAWLLFVCFRVMYADPGHIYASAFRLVVATFLIYVFIKVNRTRHSMKGLGQVVK